MKQTSLTLKTNPRIIIKNIKNEHKIMLKLNTIGSYQFVWWFDNSFIKVMILMFFKTNDELFIKINFNNFGYPQYCVIGHLKT